MRFNAAFVPILILLCFLFAVWIPMFDGLADIPLLGKVFAFLELTPVVVAITLLVVAIKNAIHAGKSMPADLVIDGDVVTIHGGPHHGTTLTSQNLNQLQLDEVKREERGMLAGLRDLGSDAALTETRLELKQRGKLVAEAITTDEQRTLRTVHRMLHDLGRTPKLAKQTGDEVETLACTSCGAPVSPDDRAEVTCAACTKLVAVPETLRERVRVSRLAPPLAAMRTRAITDMTELPDARTTGILLRALGWMMLLAWPAMFLALAYAHVELGVGVVALALVTGIAMDVAIYYAMLPRVVVRQAFPVALEQFAARAGGHDTPLCRHCSAPLPAVDDATTIVRCVFCDADNLLGRELVRALPALASEARELEPAARAWRDDRRRSRMLGGIGLVVLATGVAMSVIWLPRLRMKHFLIDCGNGWSAACEELPEATWHPLLRDGCFGAKASPFVCSTLGELTPDADEKVRAALRDCALSKSDDCYLARSTCRVEANRELPSCRSLPPPPVKKKK